MKTQDVTQLFDTISPSYDLVNRLVSFGIDQRWRQTMLKEVPQVHGQTVCDLATGTGDQISVLAKSPFIQTLYGFDLSTQMLKIGQEKLKKANLLKKAILQVGNALSVPVKDEFCDLATISFGIRNVAEPVKCLIEMHRILKPTGKALILEFSMPKSKLVRNPYLIYLRHILPKIGGFISKSPDAYVYLNQTIESFPSGNAFLQMLQTAGFHSAKQIPLSFGIASLYIGHK